MGRSTPDYTGTAKGGKTLSSQTAVFLHPKDPVGLEISIHNFPLSSSPRSFASIESECSWIYAPNQRQNACDRSSKRRSKSAPGAARRIRPATIPTTYCCRSTYNTVLASRTACRREANRKKMLSETMNG